MTIQELAKANHTEVVDGNKIIIEAEWFCTSEILEFGIDLAQDLKDQSFTADYDPDTMKIEITLN